MAGGFLSTLSATPLSSSLMKYQALITHDQYFLRT